MFLSFDQGTSFRKFRIIYRWSDLTVQCTQQGKYKKESSFLIISVWDMLKHSGKYRHNLFVSLIHDLISEVHLRKTSHPFLSE